LFWFYILIFFEKRESQRVESENQNLYLNSTLIIVEYPQFKGRGGSDIKIDLDLYFLELGQGGLDRAPIYWSSPPPKSESPYAALIDDDWRSMHM